MNDGDGAERVDSKTLSREARSSLPIFNPLLFGKTTDSLTFFDEVKMDRR
jgi:hypothetical protein